MKMLGDAVQNSIVLWCLLWRHITEPVRGTRTRINTGFLDHSKSYVFLSGQSLPRDPLIEHSASKLQSLLPTLKLPNPCTLNPIVTLQERPPSWYMEETCYVT